jgi:hypothetical protein
MAGSGAPWTIPIWGEFPDSRKRKDMKDMKSMKKCNSK